MVIFIQLVLLFQKTYPMSMVLEGNFTLIGSMAITAGEKSPSFFRCRGCADYISPWKTWAKNRLSNRFHCDTPRLWSGDIHTVGVIWLQCKLCHPLNYGWYEPNHSFRFQSCQAYFVNICRVHLLAPDSCVLLARVKSSHCRRCGLEQVNRTRFRTSPRQFKA